VPATKTRRRRGKLATTVLALVAAAIVVVSMAGGFVVTRYLGGQALLPTAVAFGSTPSTTATSTTVARIPTTRVRAKAMVKVGDAASDFAVDVPNDWQQFTQNRLATDSLLARAQVFFINRDGTQELSVQHFTNFPKPDAYLNAVKALPQVAVSPVQPASVPGFTSGQLLDYGQDTGGPLLPRTVAVVLVKGNDLWVVGVKGTTGGTSNADAAARNLFNQIYPQFEVTG
jgi:hypothetical protein